MKTLISMKMSAEEAKEEYGIGSPTAEPGNLPKYPYGLSISLCDDSLKKLGMSSPPAVGTIMTLTAMVQVVSTGTNEQVDGDKESRAELQITEMSLDASGMKTTDMSKKLYG